MVLRLRNSTTRMDQVSVIHGDYRSGNFLFDEASRRLGAPPVLAFTATAGVKAQRRILASLGVPQARVVVTGVDRPNISLLRLPLEADEDRLRLTASLLRQMPGGRAMIFVPTIKVGLHAASVPRRGA